MSSADRSIPHNQQATRSGRKRRATRGNLRRQANLDGVIVEETLSFLMPSSISFASSLNIHNNNGTPNDKETDVAGDGCYVSSTINNRRYYGILVDQSALKRASELHFMQEAASIDLNRKMRVLYLNKHDRLGKQDTPTNHVVNGNLEIYQSKKENSYRDDENVRKKQKTNDQISDPIPLVSNSSLPYDKKSFVLNHRNDATSQKFNNVKKLYDEDRQVQKFEYISPAITEKNSPGYRKLLATYASITAASEGCSTKANEIHKACENGGDFVGAHYFQYQVDENTLQAQHASKSHEGSVGFRTSLSLSTFLGNITLPPWYPLSNLKIDQSKILNMLQMKKNNKGGVEWDKERTEPNSIHGKTCTLPVQQPLFPIKPRNTYRIGVLGGGIAGLSCAAELLRIARDEEKLEIEITLFEGRSRFGGRLCTDSRTFKSLDGKEFPVDLGASWIHGIEKNPLTDIAKEAKVDFVRASEEVKMLTSNMREVDKDCDKRMGKLFDELLDQAAEDCWNKDEYFYNKGRHQKAVRWYASNLSPTQSHDSSSPVATDVPKHRHTSDISVDRAIGLALKKKHDRAHLSYQDHHLLLWNTKNTEYALGANISDLSMRYWDADERHAFGGDHVLLRQGYSKIVEHILNKCKEHLSFKSILNFSVGRVEYSRQSATLPYPNRKLRSKRCINVSDSCRVFSKDGELSHDFDFIVCALPLGVLKDSEDSSQTAITNTTQSKSGSSGKVVFNPPLPMYKRDAINNVGFGLLDKVYLQFPRPFWRKSGNREFLSGYPFLGDEQDLFGNASGFNAHHYMFFDVGRSLYGADAQNAPHILLTLISGREAVASERMSEIQLVEDVMKTLHHLFSSVDIPNPIAAKRTKWGSDEFSRGSYTYLPPGSTDQDYHTLQSPCNGHTDIPRLFWAGEHTTSLHPSMAHGAHLSGIRAAREVISATELKSSKDDLNKIDVLIPVSVYRANRPLDNVQCSLCHQPGSRRKEGALCAFRRGKQLVLVHTNCSSYCPEVEVKHGVWKNVIKAVNRGKHISCSLCRRNGATIGCVHSQCTRSFHFGCCEDTGWNFARNGKAFLCDSHRNNMQEDFDNPISINYYRSEYPYLPVVCNFCGKLGDTNNEGKLLGFQRSNKRKVLVHENCLRYSTVVDTWNPSTQSYENVFEALSRSQKCFFCHKGGASICCADASCTFHYHYLCAEQTGWKFQAEDSEFKCKMHRSSTHVPKTQDLILPPPSSLTIENISHRSGFIQHDLFCSGALSSKGSDAVHLPQKEKENKFETTNQDSDGKTTLKETSISNANEEASDEYEDEEDSDEYDSDGENDDQQENLMQPFTPNPHFVDPEIGRTYLHSILITANRLSVSNPWKIDLNIFRSTSSKTSTLRVDSRESVQVPYGMKNGDIIISINGIQIGSKSLSVITQILLLMKTSVELKFLVLRKTSP